VPGYYHRRNQNSGDVQKDSCCDDTATEYVMMEKLMVDTLVRFARDYKVDGFRFDIMGFHTLDNLKNSQAALKAVDQSIYIYGEGWNFGDVQDDRRFQQARQANMGTTGIGTFSDRIRDPIRGGGPFDAGQAHVTSQGFINGQFYDPNGSNTGAATELTGLLRNQDLIRTFIAGGLRSYSFVNAAGNTVQSSGVDYGGQQAGYTEDPSEAINYIAAHDNETLWDISAYKHPRTTPTAERVRAQVLGHSMILLAQGIPFIHAGEEILRSKSMDRNTFDSGDWFNEVDWTRATGKWGIGFPLEGDNSGNYAVLPPIFSDPTNNPNQVDRTFSLNATQDFLRVRKSTALFRLRTADQIKSRLRFLNTGPFQKPGVMAYKIDGCSEPELPGQPYGAVVVIHNATKAAQTINEFGNETYTLHPVQASPSAADAVVRTGASHGANGFVVPARSTAVFVRAEQTSCAPYPRPLFVRGLAGDWGTSRPLDFVAGPNYSSTYNSVPAGQTEFKIADANWTADTNCGGAVDGVNVQLGRPLVISCFNDSKNLRLNVPTQGSYVFALNATDLTNPLLTVSRAPPLAAQMFVRGSFNDWGNAPQVATPMTYDGVSRYRATVAFPTPAVPGVNGGAPFVPTLPASINFKVADAGWTGPTNCGAPDGGSGAVTIGTAFTLACNNSSQNLTVNIPSAGSYLFNVDATNPAAPTLTIERAPFDAALFVRGLGDDWSDAASNRLQYVGGGTYEYLRRLPLGNDDFKIADSGWTAGTDCGASAPLALGAALTLACAGPGNGNITLPAMAPGVYFFSLNAMDPMAPQLTVTGP
jgi:pullulanase